MAKLNVEQLNKTLAKVDYPIDKHDLIRYAEYKGIDEGLLRSLKQLPIGQYTSLDKVLQTLLSLEKTTIPKVNLVQLNKILGKLEYPVSKRDLLKIAEYKGVDERILRRFKQLPRQSYETPQKVRHTIFEIENN